MAVDIGPLQTGNISIGPQQATATPPAPTPPPPKTDYQMPAILAQ